MVRSRAYASRVIGFALLCLALPLLRDLAVVQRPGTALVAAALGYGALLLAAVIAMSRSGIAITEAGIRPPTLRSALLGITAGILVVAPVWRTPAISTSRVVWLVVLVSVEEVAFRGVLFALLRRIGGIPLAIAGSSVVFTVAHTASAGWAFLVVVALAGLYLGLLRALSGDLWTSGVVHLLMDLVSLT